MFVYFVGIKFLCILLVVTVVRSSCTQVTRQSASVIRVAVIRYVYVLLCY